MKSLSSRAWSRPVLLVVSLLAFVLVLGVFNVVATPRAEARTQGPGLEPLVVETVPVEWEAHYPVVRSFLGRVEARQESEVGFEISGTIAEVFVDEGETVAAGQPLAALDTARTEARRAERVALRDQARARQELAELTLARTREARERNAVSARDLDQAEQEIVAMRAAVRQAQAGVEALDVELDKARLASPFEARVARRYVDNGRVVDAGAPVLQLVEVSRPEVRVALAADFVDALAVGDELELRINGEFVAADVARILPLRDRASRGVDVVLQLREELGRVRVGDLARLELERRVEEEGFWLPLQALTEGVRGLFAVYAIVSSDAPRVERRDVELLHTAGDRVFVRGALESQEEVVSGALHRLAPGTPVRPRGQRALAQ